MAKYNEILVGRFNRALQKLLQMKGEAPAPQLSSELQPAFQIPLGNEFRYLESWDRYAISSNQTGQATFQVGFFLRNPAGSNVIAVVEKIAISTSAVQQVQIGLGSQAVNLVSVLTTQRLDSRCRPQGTLIPSFATNYGGGVNTQIGVIVQIANDTIDCILTDDMEITVLPGDALQLATTAAATGLTWWVMWRERFLEESERT